jgi:hypothetical protein
MNDNIVYYDEFPKYLIDKSDRGGSDEERMFKQLLTTNKVAVQVFDKDLDTGKRITKTTYAEWIGVFFGSCNLIDLQTRVLSTSMGRRWQVVSVSEVDSGQRSLTETRLTELLKTVKEDANRAEFDKRFHVMQALFFETSKLIYCKALTDVSLHTAALIMLNVSSWLGQNGYPEPNTAQVDRIMMLARINTICDALARTFFYKGAPYEGKPIQLEHLKSLDRLLFCSVRHIVRAIGEAADVLVDPLERDIRKAMGILHEQESEGNAMLYAYKMTDDYIMDENGVKKYETKQNPSYLWFYLTSKGPPFRALAQKIKNIMATEKMNIVPSEDAIELRLTKWCSRTFEASEWTLESDGRKNPVLRELPGTRIKRSVAYTSEGKSSKRLLIHAEFIRPETMKLKFNQYGTKKNTEFKQHTEVLKDALRSVLNRKYQIPRRLVFCQDQQKPDLLEILEIEGGTENSKLISVPQTNRMSKEAAKCLGDASKFYDTARKKSFFTLLEDLDLYGLQKRNDELSITELPVVPESLRENPLAITDDDENLRENFPEEDEEAYDFSAGYFLGKNLHKLFVSGGRKAASSLQKKHIQMIFDKLDETPQRNCMRDRDFDPDQFIIKQTEMGENIYHWTNMADEVTLEQFKAGNYSAPYRVRRSDLALIPSNEAKQILDTEAADCARAYKPFAPLISLEEDMLEQRYYLKQSDSHFEYPGSLKNETKEGRWNMWETASVQFESDFKLENALSQDAEISAISGAKFKDGKLLYDNRKIKQKHLEKFQPKIGFNQETVEKLMLEVPEFLTKRKRVTGEKTEKFNGIVAKPIIQKSKKKPKKRKVDAEKTHQLPKKKNEKRIMLF